MELKNYHQKFEELPESAQDYLLSPDTIKLIHDAGRSEGLFDGEVALLTKITTDVLMGLIKEAELFQKIEGGFGVSQTTAQNLTNKLINTVLPSIKAGLDQALHIETVVPPKPAFVREPPIIPQESETTTKATAPTQAPQPQEEQIAHETPLILHKEEEVMPAKKAPSYSAQRPVFYKPTFSEEYKRNAETESAARVELGEETKKAEPQTERTPSQPSRIVHYSEFRTPLVPFGDEQAPQDAGQATQPQGETPKEEKSQPEVHPNNVVDLKDLPLK